MCLYNVPMNLRHPLLAVCVYLGIGVSLFFWGVRDGSFVIVDMVGGVVLYSFFASLLPGR